MNEFFNFCLRKLTTIDEAPTPEARRGARFEQAVWDFFRRNLKVELLVEVNSRFVSGTVQGEIDVAFRAGEVIVVLECKSWQKRRDYFRGDRKAIDRRHEQLRRTVEEQIPRNVGLLRSHLGEKALGRCGRFCLCRRSGVHQARIPEPLVRSNATDSHAPRNPVLN